MSEELRMDAYYYSFDGTGRREIDMILSAVACAGKAFHHTDYWTEECEWPPHHGNTPVEWIESAAANAASTVAAMDAALQAADEFVSAILEKRGEMNDAAYPAGLQALPLLKQIRAVLGKVEGEGK